MNVSESFDGNEAIDMRPIKPIVNPKYELRKSQEAAQSHPDDRKPLQMFPPEPPSASAVLRGRSADTRSQASSSRVSSGDSTEMWGKRAKKQRDFAWKGVTGI